MEGNTLKKHRILVLGANGQLGREFAHIAPSYEYCHFYFANKSEADINEVSSLKAVINDQKPDYIINCAAYTAVDKAESEPQLCYETNAYACQPICEAIKSAGSRLVHFSSDYVYHTYGGFPLAESDPTEPRGVYAKSKLEGERIIRQSGAEALILRTSWVVSSFGHNFVKSMLRLGKEKSELNVVSDQYGTPTYARQLAAAVMDILLLTESDAGKAALFNETYNYSPEGIISWYDLASAIMDLANLPCTVKPIPTTAYPTPAVRPQWSVMSKSKIRQAFGLETGHWHASLRQCLEDLGEYHKKE